MLRISYYNCKYCQVFFGLTEGSGRAFLKPWKTIREGENQSDFCLLAAGPKGPEASNESLDNRNRPRMIRWSGLVSTPFKKIPESYFRLEAFGIPGQFHIAVSGHRPALMGSLDPYGPFPVGNPGASWGHQLLIR